MKYMREENEKIKNIYSVRELAFSSNGECILFLLEVSNNNLVKAPPPTPKTISAQVHANPMKFSGYVGAVVERLW
jgi:hypothetical protein